jgi:hypothetical protein
MFFRECERQHKNYILCTVNFAFCLGRGQKVGRQTYSELNCTRLSPNLKKFCFIIGVLIRFRSCHIIETKIFINYIYTVILLIILVTRHEHYSFSANHFNRV